MPWMPTGLLGEDENLLLLDRVYGITGRQGVIFYYLFVCLVAASPDPSEPSPKPHHAQLERTRTEQLSH